MKSEWTQEFEVKAGQRFREILIVDQALPSRLAELLFWLGQSESHGGAVSDAATRTEAMKFAA